MDAASKVQRGQKLDNAIQEHATRSRCAYRQNRNRKSTVPPTAVVATEAVSFDEDAEKESAYVSPDVATESVSDVTDEETCSTATGEETPEDSEDSAPEDYVPEKLAKPDLPISSTLADDQIIFGVAKLMKAMCRECKASVKKTGFQSKKLPTMSLSGYASRIHSYFRCSDECFVLTMVYIDRIVKRSPDIRLTDLTCHRLLLTSAMVAAKYHDDEYASNEYYARVGGIDTRELNAMEAEFLQLLGWNLFVGASEYDWFLSTLRRVP